MTESIVGTKVIVPFETNTKGGKDAMCGSFDGTVVFLDRDVQGGLVIEPGDRWLSNITKDCRPRKRVIFAQPLELVSSKAQRDAEKELAAEEEFRFNAAVAAIARAFEKVNHPLPLVAATRFIGKTDDMKVGLARWTEVRGLFHNCMARNADLADSRILSHTRAIAEYLLLKEGTSLLDVDLALRKLCR